MAPRTPKTEAVLVMTDNPINNLGDSFEDYVVELDDGTFELTLRFPKPELIPSGDEFVEGELLEKLTLRRLTGGEVKAGVDKGGAKSADHMLKLSADVSVRFLDTLDAADWAYASRVLGKMVDVEGEDLGIVTHEDLTRTITLAYPISITKRTADGSVDERLTEIHCHRFSARQLKAASEMKGGKAADYLMSQSTKLPSTVLDRLDGKDWKRLSNIALGFTGSDPRTGS